MMKKITGAFLLLFIMSFHATAEEGTSSASNADAANTLPSAEEAATEKKPPVKPQTDIMDKLFFGCAINLSGGNYTALGIEPLVGYRITPKFSAGVKVKYDYIKDSRYDTTYETSNYGGSVFARYRLTKQFYAQIEGAEYNYELFYSNGSSEREWVPYVFAGAGYTKPLGKKSWLSVQILFDILQNDKSPYDDWTPFFSVGAGTGF